jgi:Zn-dependent M28 family amino/carboxypeptidase
VSTEDQGGYAPKPKGAKATLILCAHIDSAWASRVGREWVANLRVALREMWLPSVVALGLLAIVKIAGDHLAWYPFQQPWWLFDPLVVVYAMAFGTLQLGITLLGWSKEVSPGAHDNASGVATVLTLAEHFAQQPPQRLALQYVLFTAEEGGLLGSKAFVKQTPMDKRDTYVLNFDMVGSGQRLYYVRGADLFPPRFTDKRLNALLKEIVPDIKSRWYWYGGGSDFHSFLAKGIPATSLQTRGNRRAASVYHTTGDTIEVIEPDTLGRVVNTAVQVIRRLDA